MTDESAGVEPRRVSRLRLIAQDGQALQQLNEQLGGGPPAPPGGGSQSDPDPIIFSEDMMAKELVVQDLKDDWRFVPRSDTEGWWYTFRDGQCWRIDETHHVREITRRVCRRIAAWLRDANKSPGLQRQLGRWATIRAVENISRSDDRMGMSITQFDRDPWILNTPGGILDLHDGVRRPADRMAFCSHLAGATPEGDCPHFKTFLQQITNNDPHYEAYLLRLMGYALVGDRREEIFVFIYGPSNTGKSKFVECMRLLMGDYGTAAPMDSFIVTKTEKHPTDLASFVGMRLVTAAETEEGRRWDQQRLTTLTGRDRVKARFMRGNFFEYVPQCLLIFHGNWRPRLGAVSDAMRRRMHTLPFLHKPAVIDPDLIEKFKKELDGIMALALKGCLDWQERGGLDPPKVVTEATALYFELEDTLGQWVDERCVIDPLNPNRLSAASRALYHDYVQWQTGKGYVVSEPVFIGRLELMQGLIRAKHLPGDKRGFFGIALKSGQHTMNV